VRALQCWNERVSEKLTSEQVAAIGKEQCGAGTSGLTGVKMVVLAGDRPSLDLCHRTSRGSPYQNRLPYSSRRPNCAGCFRRMALRLRTEGDRRCVFDTWAGRFLYRACQRGPLRIYDWQASSRFHLGDWPVGHSIRRRSRCNSGKVEERAMTSFVNLRNPVDDHLLTPQKPTLS
jgi:hypothetical protein